jgi:thiosulfate dehydrogenase [quinone] large subunit
MVVDRLENRTPVALKQWPIVLLRVYTGIFFAYHGIAKIRRDDFASGMEGFIRGSLGESFTFYRPFLESVVLPDKGLFAALVAWGELAMGLALILGFATRYAAFFGAFMVLNFWFAKGLGPMAGGNQDIVWIIILIVLGFIPAGKIVGLDDGLSDRLPFLR